MIPAILVMASLAATAPAAELRIQELSVGGAARFDLQHRLDEGLHQTLLGQDVHGSFEHAPVLLYRREGRWQRADLGDAGQQGWVHASVLEGTGALGILDNDVESPGWELTILRRPRARGDWEVSAVLRKPYYLATFDRLLRTPRGDLELDVVLDEGYGSGLAPGRYRTSSRDLARTWSTFERIGPVD